jgi:hypothetical protein
VTAHTALLVGLGYVALIAIFELWRRSGGEQPVDASIGACVTGYLVAISIPLTLALKGNASGAFEWAVTFTVFAAVSAILAWVMHATRVQWPTWVAVSTIAVAASISGTLFAPFRVPPVAWIYAVAVFVATAMTILLLFLNERIFDRRKRILQRLFDKLAEYKPDVVQDRFPALKLAAIKYGGTLHGASGANMREPTPEDEPRTSRLPLVISAIAYLVFSVIGYVLLLVPICTLFGGSESCGAGWISAALFWTEKPSEIPELTKAVAVAGAAFLGAHIFTLRFLFKAALNSELNQFKWLRGALHSRRPAALPRAQRCAGCRAHFRR